MLKNRPKSLISSPLARGIRFTLGRPTGSSNVLQLIGLAVLVASFLVAIKPKILWDSLDHFTPPNATKSPSSSSTPSHLNGTALSAIVDRRATSKNSSQESSRVGTLDPSSTNETYENDLGPVTSDKTFIPRRSTELTSSIDNQTALLTLPPTLMDPHTDGHPAGQSISGWVLDEWGQPVSKIIVMAKWRRPKNTAQGDITHSSAARERYTQSDDEGFYAFGGLKDGQYAVHTEPTYLYAPTGRMVQAGLTSVDLVLIAQRQLALNGTVRDSRSQPLVGVKVIPFSPSTRPDYTDSEGKYQLELALKGSTRVLSLRFVHDGYRAQMQSVRLPDQSLDRLDVIDFDVVMERHDVQTLVSGRIKSSNGAPVSGERIQLYSPRLRLSYGAFTDKEGKFVIPGVEVSDDYGLSMHARGPYQDYTETNIWIGKDGLELELILEPLEAGRLKGHMINVDGQPVPHFTGFWRSKNALLRTLPVSSDDRGHYEVENAPAGELIFESRFYPRTRITGVHLSPSDEQIAPLIVDWGDYQLYGRVVDSFGNPVLMPRIVLSWSHREGGLHSFSTRAGVADAQGHFLFTRLGPGPHRLNIDAPGFLPARLIHDVGSDDAELMVQLNPTDVFEKSSP